MDVEDPPRSRLLAAAMNLYALREGGLDKGGVEYRAILPMSGAQRDEMSIGTLEQAQEHVCIHTATTSITFGRSTRGYQHGH